MAEEAEYPIPRKGLEDEYIISPPPYEEEESQSSSESEHEGDEEGHLQALEYALLENLHNYDVHVQYIKALRKYGHVEKLRIAREAMSSLFPLSPTMWQEWAKDEACLDTRSEAVSSIERLYERGVCDYMSVPLWSDYLNFIQERDKSVSQCTEEGIAKIRALFERALTAAGLHMSEGGKLWTVYREFEQALLITMEEIDSKVKSKQVDCIRNTFRRQLSVPLADMDATLEDYKAWEQQQGNAIGIDIDDLTGIPSNVISAYRKAVEMYKSRADYEEKLAAGKHADVNQLQHYLNYIKFEKSSGDPARVQVLYERAITEFPVGTELWLGYTHYLDSNLKVPHIIKSVYARAVRSCPWVEALWAKYILALERFDASEEEISRIFEQSLQCGFSNPDEYLDLFLTRADGLRRKVMKGDEISNTSWLALLRETFQFFKVRYRCCYYLGSEGCLLLVQQPHSCPFIAFALISIFHYIKESVAAFQFERAAEYLSEHLNYTDQFLRLHAYWARLECQLAKDMAAARGVWESLIKKSGGMLQVWQGYIDMELALNNVSEARAIFKRCYSKRFKGNSSEEICEAWLRFEREHGSLVDLDRAKMKVTPRLEELRLFQHQQEGKSQGLVEFGLTGQKNYILETTTYKEGPKNNSSKQSNRFQASKKRKTGLGYNEENVEKKRQKCSSGRIVSSEASDREEFGLKNVDNAERDTESGKQVSRVSDQATGEANLSPFKQAVYMDECTAYVSNLAMEVNEEHIRQFFSECGGVKAIRLVRNRSSGISKGFAYIDFENEEKLSAAVTKNKQKLFGKKISIAQSNPKESQRRGSVRGCLASGRGGQAPFGKGGDTRIEAKQGISSKSAPIVVSHRRGGHVRLTGSNTFAMPRNVARPLGWGAKDSKGTEPEETPKSNEEFRKMLLGS